MTAFQQLSQYVQEDIQSVIQELRIRTTKPFKCTDIKYGCSEQDLMRSNCKCPVTATFTDGNTSFTISWQYELQGDTLYMDKDIEDIIDEVIHNQKSLKVSASTSTSSHSYVRGADDPSDVDFIDDFEDDPQIDDALDNIQNQVEDIQDSIDEIEEDDTDIEVDNNIANKYIAECDRCHGVFISAVPESDQQVEKISGICPLCDKDSDQYLKWIIRSVER